MGKETKLRGNQYWLLVFDEATSKSWRFFLLKKKSLLGETMVSFFTDLEVKNVDLKGVKIQIESALENESFRALCRCSK